MLNNIILKTDSYKTSHYLQYPPDTKRIFSYLEARGEGDDDIMFFGLQYIINRYLQGKVFDGCDITEAGEVITRHMGSGVFNEKGWRSLLKKHEGRLPIKIHAVKEGSIHKRGDVLMTIENTDPEFFWPNN